MKILNKNYFPKIKRCFKSFLYLETVAVTVLVLISGNTWSQSVNIGSGTIVSMNSSVITLNGSWNNSATFNENTGKVVFTGINNQTIVNPETFFDITVNKTSGILQLSNDITVNGIINIENGTLDLNSYNLTIGNNGQLNEHPGNLVTGGTITIAKDISNPSSENVGGLGAEISSSKDLGITNIVRGSAVQTIDGNSSIGRYYDITPTNNSALNATLVFHYDTTELNGISEQTLQLFRSTDGGIHWSQMGGTVNTTSKTVTLSGINSFSRWTLSSATGSHFTKIWESPYLPMNIYITSATVDGVNLGAGDEIAVFDGDNCVGLGLLSESIPSGGYLSVIASTDDPTSPETDGFVPGNTISFKFWDSNKSSEITRITPSYSAGDGTFSSLGTAVAGLSGAYTVNQDVNLNNGWNIFSLMVTPDDPDMLNLLNPLITSGTLVKVQDENGNAVEQLPVIGWVNNIGNWSSTEGYYLKVNAASNLNVSDPLIQLPVDIPLKNAWNIISYPISSDQDAMSVLQPLITANQLVKVQDEDGNAVEQLPAIGWVNNIGNFTSGQGYYLKANANTTLTLNEPTASIVKEGKKTNKNSLTKTTANHFVPIFSSPYLPMNFYVTGASLSTGGSLESGDEIGIFDGSNCVGAVVLTGPISSYVSLIASTDDPTTTEVDGFISGHNISYKFWKSSTSTEISDYIPVYSEGDGTFSSLGTAVVSFINILPVELVSFSAEKNENHVVLKWETATEVNNYGFEIQRSSVINQQSANAAANNRTLNSIDWEKIGFIKGSGNSNSAKNYSFTDKNLVGGSKFIYRLKQIDNDGKFSYSDETEVEVVPDKYELFQNYPNPFNPVTNIKFQVVNPGIVTLKVYDILGNEVATIVNKELAPGFYNYQWNASKIASGIYLYRITAGNFTAIKKMILLR